MPINKLSLRVSLLRSKQSQLSASSHERDVPVPSVSSVFPHSSISVDSGPGELRAGHPSGQLQKPSWQS